MQLTSTALPTTVKIPIPSGKMVVSDPCYVDEDDTGTELIDRAPDLGHVLDVKPGDWVASVELGEPARGWGERVCRLVARHAHAGAASGWITTRIGAASVDSGQMYIGDRSNLQLDYDALLAAYGDDFGINCLAVQGGIVSSTGIGDGTYPVTVMRNNQDEIVEVTVDFALEDEEEEEEA